MAIHARHTLCLANNAAGIDVVDWCSGAQHSAACILGHIHPASDTRHIAGVAARVMATQAQEWRTCFQQCIGRGSMGVVAVAAVISHGLVAVDEGTAFFGMAGIASRNDRVLDQGLDASRSVRVVAA